MRGGIKNAIYLKYRLIITGYAFIQKQEKIHRVRILESGLLLTYIHTYTHTYAYTHTPQNPNPTHRIFQDKVKSNRAFESHLSSHLTSHQISHLDKGFNSHVWLSPPSLHPSIGLKSSTEKKETDEKPNRVILRDVCMYVYICMGHQKSLCGNIYLFIVVWMIIRYDVF